MYSVLRKMVTDKSSQHKTKVVKLERKKDINSKDNLCALGEKIK